MDTSTSGFPGYNPTAPPLNYPDMYPSLAPYNGNCAFCSKVLHHLHGTIISPRCGHSYHLTCGLDWLSDNPHSCHNCHTDPRYSGDKTKVTIRYFQKQRDQDTGGIPIDHGNDPSYTRYLEERFGKQGLMDDQDDGSEFQAQGHPVGSDLKRKELTLLQKTKLGLNLIKPGDDLHWRTLKARSVTIDKMISAKFSLSDMFSRFELKTWGDLLEMGLQKEHVSKLGLKKLIAMYGVNYNHLSKDLGVSLTYLFQSIKPTHLELINLGLYFDVLKSNGLSIFHIKDSGFSINDWKDLGMTKDFLLEQNIDSSVMSSILDWRIIEAIRVFDLDRNERLKLSMEISYNSMRGPIRARG